MALVLGFACRSGGALSGVVVAGTSSAVEVRHHAGGDLARGRTVTPHADFRDAPRPELEDAVAATQVALELAARDEVGALAAVAAAGRLTAVGVIVPRWRKVDDLGARVGRRRYAEHADEHLVADAVVAAARELGAPVVAVDGAEALRRAERFLGLDRQALGEEARRAQPAMGDGFSYRFRLPVLAARVAMATLEAGEGGQVGLSASR